jgi:hypothetical protein
MPTCETQTADQTNKQATNGERTMNTNEFKSSLINTICEANAALYDWDFWGYDICTLLKDGGELLLSNGCVADQPHVELYAKFMRGNVDFASAKTAVSFEMRCPSKSVVRTISREQAAKAREALDACACSC